MGEGFYFSFPKEVDLALPSADFFINGPASILTGVELWKMRKWGYAMAWFTSGFYLYASVEIFVWSWQESNMTLSILLPQFLAVIVAFAMMRTCWRWKDHFS